MKPKLKLKPVKIGKTTIYISPEKDPEFARALYVIFHQPTDVKGNEK
jgi:hypothetical protein